MADVASSLEADLLAAISSAVEEAPKPATSDHESKPAPIEARPAPDQAPMPPPKRPRTPGPEYGGSAKRLKTDNDVYGIDMAAMLQSALGSFDEVAGQTIEAEDVSRATEVDAKETTPIETQSAALREEKSADPIVIMTASSKPLYMLRAMTVPCLGNFAVQILLRLSQQSRT